MLEKKKSTWKHVGLGVVALASAAALAACGNGSKQSSKDEINWYFRTEINSLDISKSTDTYSGTVIGNSGSNLLRVNAKGKTVPDLAKKLKCQKTV